MSSSSNAKSGSGSTSHYATAAAGPPAAAAAKGGGGSNHLFDEWKNENPNTMISTKDAKQLYFQTTADLAMLPCHRLGYCGFGTGPPVKCYTHKDLVESALSKFGRQGVMKKLEARHKREEKKRMKEREAELARKRMKMTNDNVGNINAASAAVANSSASSTTAAATKTSSSSSAGTDSQEIKKLRSSLLKLAKKNMGFEMSGAPKNWRFEVPGTTKKTFAALMDQPTDVELTTFVKNGAYYTIQRYDVMKLFGLTKMKDDDDKASQLLMKNFKREGVAQKIGETVIVRYKPSTMELSVSGYAEISHGIYY